MAVPATKAITNTRDLSNLSAPDLEIKIKGKSLVSLWKRTTALSKANGDNALLKCKVTEIPCGRGESREKGD